MNEINEVNETNEINTKEILYDKNETVRNLNKVDGFEPKDYLRKEETVDGQSFYLDTKYRLLWFRLKYPNGKLTKIPVALKENYATFEVRVYADKNDEESNYLANGFASRYKDENDAQFGLSFVETAETAALGRALKDAGFGTQFCDVALPNDGKIVDAAIDIKFELDEKDADKSSTVLKEGEKASQSAVGDNSSENKTDEKPKEETPKKVELTSDMTIEELVKNMSVEYAEKVVVEQGYDKGRTLGDIRSKRPQGLEFHATRGSNNFIKAAAIILIADEKKKREEAV